jgi:hypothetical protein
MTKAVGLTIRREDEAPWHRKKAQLLPLASSIPLTSLRDAHRALDEGLAAFAAPSQTTATDFLTPSQRPFSGKIEWTQSMLGYQKLSLPTHHRPQTLWGPFTSYYTPPLS